MKYIGDITHSEKFTNKDWEEKTKYTKVWALFKNEEKGYYSVNFLGQWLNVFQKQENTVKTKENIDNSILIEDIPF